MKKLLSFLFLFIFYKSYSQKIPRYFGVDTSAIVDTVVYIESYKTGPVRSEFISNILNTNWMLSAFGSSYPVFKNHFTRIYNNEKIKLIDDLVIKPTSDDLASSDYLFEYNQDTIVMFGSKFDNLYFICDEDIDYSIDRLFSYRSFEDTLVAQKFYKNLINKIFVIDQLDIQNTKEVFGEFIVGKPFNSKTKNYRINIFINDKNIICRLSTSSMYEETKMFKKYFLYANRKLKDIDANNSYRGIKFGTNISEIKKIVELEAYESGITHTYRVVKNEKYLNWLSFSARPYNCFFYFSKDYRLSEVSLAVDCLNDGDYNEIKQKLIDEIGEPLFERFGNYVWHGANLKIELPAKKEKDSNYIHISIASKKINRFYDTDY